MDDVEAVPDVDLDGEVAEKPRRPVGRPKGSKTKNRKAKPASSEGAGPPKAKASKSKVGLNMGGMPEDLVAGIAQMPLRVASEVVNRASEGQVELRYSAASVNLVVGSFREWLGSLDVEMTPGWALLSAYTVAFSEAFVVAQVAQARAPPSSETVNGHAKYPSGEGQSPSSAPLAS